jgi:hypothetical protein
LSSIIFEQLTEAVSVLEPFKNNPKPIEKIEQRIDCGNPYGE